MDSKKGLQVVSPNRGRSKT